MNKLFILILCIAGIFVYSNSLNNGFVFDDNALVVSNPIIKSLSSLPQAFKSGLYDHWIGIPLYDRMYRPLQTVSYALDYKIWGLNPFGFHLTNLLLHLLNGFLVYLLLFLLFRNQLLSFFTSFLFLIHPVQVSSVSYIAARGDLLSLLFMLSSLIMFYKLGEKNKIIYYILSIIAAAFALLSRENSLFLFAFLVLTIYCMNKKPRYYLLVAPFIVLDLVYIILRFGIFGYKGLYIHPEFLEFPLRLINFLNIILQYILLLILPLNLHLMRVVPFIKGYFEPKSILVLIFIALCILIALRFRKHKALFFGSFWFLAALIPVFFFLDGFPLFEQAMMAESWLYPAVLGPFLIFSLAAIKFKTFGKVIIVVAIVVYAALAHFNNNYWKNNIVLYNRILKFTPGRNPVRKLLIDEYLLAAQPEDALSEIKKFSIYFPESRELDMAWGDYYSLIGKTDLAKEKYEQARIKNKPVYVIIEKNAKR